MNLIRNIFGSSLGKKYVMAITGALLFLFVVAHLIGNLQVFLGPEAINRYGHFLQSNVELLWPARIGLIVLVALHVWSAVKLTAENRRARPEGYAMNQNTGSSYASRTMMMSGLIIAIFVIYHILHFTVQVKEINLTGEDFLAFQDEKNRHDVFRMMVTGFSNPWVSLFYVIGMALLCLHLSHGVSAMFQSLGLKDGAWSKPIDRFAKITALLVFLGYVSIPIAVLCGLVKNSSAVNTSKSGTYSHGDWKYVYSIEFKGTRSEKRTGELFYRNQQISTEPGAVIQTPLGKFLCFSESRYSGGWLNELPYDRAIFDRDGKVKPSVRTNLGLPDKLKMISLAE